MKRRFYTYTFVCVWEREREHSAEWFSHPSEDKVEKRKKNSTIDYYLQLDRDHQENLKVYLINKYFLSTHAHVLGISNVPKKM